MMRATERLIDARLGEADDSDRWFYDPKLEPKTDQISDRPVVFRREADGQKTLVDRPIRDLTNQDLRAFVIMMDAYGSGPKFAKNLHHLEAKATAMVPGRESEEMTRSGRWFYTPFGDPIWNAAEFLIRRIALRGLPLLRVRDDIKKYSLKAGGWFLS